MKLLVTLTCVFSLFGIASLPSPAAETKASSAKQVLPVPKGYHTLTPYVSVKGANEAIDFYKRAYGAVETERMMTPDGKKIVHAEVRIGDSMLMISDDFLDSPPLDRSKYGNLCDLHIYVPDVDAVFDRAVKEGAKVKMPVADMFWGDRFGSVVDPFGLVWSISTHKKDLTKEEIDKGGEEFFKTVGKDIMDKINNTKPLSPPELK